MKPKIVSKKIVYRAADWIKVVKGKIKLPDGQFSDWHWIEGKDFVVMVAVDKKMNVYLAKEWRAAWKREILQLPAGTCQKEGEKAALAQARNELREEIGLDAKKWQKLLGPFFGAREARKVHFYLAGDLFKSEKEKDFDEVIKVVKMPFKKALRLFLSGQEPTTSYTILGLLLAKEKLKL